MSGIPDSIHSNPVVRAARLVSNRSMNLASASVTVGTGPISFADVTVVARYDAPVLLPAAAREGVASTSRMQ